MELFVSRGSVQRWRTGESRVLCSVWDGGGRGQTQRKLEDVRKKKVRKGGPRVRASVRAAGRGRLHLCGPRAGCWRPASLEGRTGLLVPEPRARRRGWRFRGAVQTCWAVARSPGAALSTPGPQLHPRGRSARPKPSGARGWGWGARAANQRGPPCGLCRPGTRRRRAGHLGLERPYWHRHGEPGAA